MDDELQRLRNIIEAVREYDAAERDNHERRGWNRPRYVEERYERAQVDLAAHVNLYIDHRVREMMRAAMQTIGTIGREE